MGAMTSSYRGYPLWIRYEYGSAHPIVSGFEVGILRIYEVLHNLPSPLIQCHTKQLTGRVFLFLCLFSSFL